MTIAYRTKFNQRALGSEIAIVGEIHTVGIVGVSTAIANTVKLVEVPLQGTVIIPGYTETTGSPSTALQFVVDYIGGYLTFHPFANGVGVSVSYSGRGSEVDAVDVNEIQIPVSVALDYSGALSTGIVKPISISAADTFTFAGIISPSITASTLTPNRIVETNGANQLVSSSTTATELSYLGGATSNIQTQLDSKQDALGFTPENIANKSTSTSLGTSNTLYPSQNAVKQYVDTGLSNKENVLGFTPENTANKDTSVSLGTSNTLYPSQNAVKVYVDTGLSGKQDNLGFTPEDVANKSTSTSLGTSNTLYPSQNAVKSYVDTGLAGKQNTLGFTPEDIANKDTSTGLGTSNTLYPSQNAVKVYVDTGLSGKQNNLGFTPVNKNGDTMTGALILNADPLVDLGAATKQYVDGVATGLHINAPAHIATTGPLSVTPAGSGVGATLTATSNGVLNPDNHAASALDRILVKNQATASQNGIYVVTNPGVNDPGGSPFILTRALDFDGSPASEVSSGDFVFVELGDVNANTGWVVSGAGVIVVDANPINWVQFSGAGTYSAGTGLTLAGTQFSVATGGITNLLVSNTAAIVESKLNLDHSTASLYSALSGKVDNTITVNGHALTSNVTVTKSDVSLSNVVNLDTSTTANITDSSNKRFVTDANLTTIGNQSGTNTGDETQATIKSKLGYAASGVDGYLTGSDWLIFSGKQASLGFTPEDVANKTIDGTLAANSDTLYPSEKAVKTYVDNHTVTGAFLNGGNSFGANATLGTNDTYSLDLKTNNLSRMSLSSTGAVAIGTTSAVPTFTKALISFDGNINTHQGEAVTLQTGLTVYSGQANTLVLQTTASTSQGLGAVISLGGRYDTDTKSTSFIKLRSGKLLSTLGDTKGYLSFQANGSANEQLIITGIGTTVIGNIGNGGYSDLTYFNGTVNVTSGGVGVAPAGSSALQVTGSSQAYGMVQVYENNNTSINNGGTIGLGGKYDSTIANGTIFALIKGGKENATNGNYVGYLSFATLASTNTLTERMRISSSGNVGIGTTNPTDNLHIEATSSAPSLKIIYNNAGLHTPYIQLSPVSTYISRLTIGGDDGGTRNTSLYISNQGYDFLTLGHDSFGRANLVVGAAGSALSNITFGGQTGTQIAFGIGYIRNIVNSTEITRAVGGITQFLIDGNSTNASTGNPVLKIGGGSVEGIARPATGRLDIVAGGVSRLIVNTVGIGIGGIAATTEKLEINGALNVGAAAGTTDGTIQYLGGDFLGRKAGAWVSMTTGGGGSALASLTDVALGSLNNGDVLTYNSGTSKWINAAPAGGGSYFLGPLINDPGSPSAGQMWLNTTDKQFKGYNGVAIVVLG